MIDENTVSQWAQQYGPLLRGYIQSRVFHAQTAEDLAQEVFCRVWQAKENYRDSGSPKAYLFCIAERLIIDWKRKKKRNYYLKKPGKAWNLFLLLTPQRII